MTSNKIQFSSSDELPTTAPSPTNTLPLIKASGLTSVFSPITHGSVIVTKGESLALLAIQTSSAILLYLSYSRDLLICKTAFPMSARASHGYSQVSKKRIALIWVKSNKSYIFIVSMAIPLRLHIHSS